LYRIDRIPTNLRLLRHNDCEIIASKLAPTAVRPERYRLGKFPFTMCIVVFNWQPESTSPLTLAANRDEFFARPTLPMHWWDDADILAGRDLQSGGTWLGVTQGARFALVTNVRDPSLRKANAPSRGLLVTAFLKSNDSPETYTQTLARSAHTYEGFNILCGELAHPQRELWFLNSHTREPVRVAAGIHTLSNASLNTSWPKTARIKAAFSHTITLANIDEQNVSFGALLNDTALADDDTLPSTGVPLDWERALSSVFIRRSDYGTRASTWLRASNDVIELHETTHTATQTHASTVAHTVHRV
jgi:uncharacterized protein with NRDE domain